MGIAEAQRQSGELEDAIQTLRAAEPPDHSAMVWRQEALAGVLSQAGERDATKAWSALADMAEDEPELLSTALQGEAKQWLEGDAPDRAEALFSDAVQVTSDPVARGWAQLGRADALIAQGKTDDAARLTASLLQIDDAEVSLQATITLARIAVTQGQWQDAINLLEHTAPWQLGPGWDTTVADIRTQAHIGAGEVGMATKTWRDLGARWPSEEEAQLPVMLGQARIAWVSGDMDEAKKFANQAKLAAVDPAYKLQAEELLLSMAQ